MRNKMILRKMQTYTMKLLKYCEGYTYETFQADSKLVDAVCV
jgi:uncharacterized protein with HEPN domain